MTTNINTLVIKLLIAAGMESRKTLAARILVLVAQCDAVSGIEKEMKSRFLILLDQCVQNPNCDSRNDFYLLAEFYNRRINGAGSNIEVAA